MKRRVFSLLDFVSAVCFVNFCKNHISVKGMGKDARRLKRMVERRSFRRVFGGIDSKDAAPLDSRRETLEYI